MKNYLIFLLVKSFDNRTEKGLCYHPLWSNIIILLSTGVYTCRVMAAKRAIYFIGPTAESNESTSHSNTIFQISAILY